MDRDNRNSRYNHSESQEGSFGGRRIRRGGYEEDYTPHYSGQRNQKSSSSSNDYSGNRSKSERSARMNENISGNNAQRRNNRKQNSYEEYPGRQKSPQPLYDVPGNARHKGGKFQGRKKKHTVGKILAIVQGVLSIVALALLMFLDVVPTKYVAIAAVLLLILWVFAYFSQFTRGTHIVGKIESVILCIVLAWGSYYLFITNSFLGAITGSTVKVDNIVIAVMQDDPAQSLADASDYTFGIQSTIDRANIDKTISQINENLGKDILTQDFDSFSGQINALYNGEVGAIIYNEAFNGNIIEEHPTFSDDIRILDNVKIETKVEVAASEKKVTKEPFTVYITGIDTYGSISTGSRSDVNILATVNPETKQILLTSTPRDYYVEFPGVTNGQLDKLTHAGNYGVDCSMKTLEQLYGISIDYYAKVNFTSVIKIVDLLGGINVYSEYDFTSIDGRHFNQGWNELDGESALAFARERKAFVDGDNQRGKNQQAVIAAMLDKAMSPAILANYAGLLGSLNDNFETNMSMNDITELIKMQLNDGTDWEIISQSVVGSNGEDYCYSLGGSAYVMIPDQASVDAAAAKIEQVLNGEVIENTSAVPEAN